MHPVKNSSLKMDRSPEVCKTNYTTHEALRAWTYSTPPIVVCRSVNGLDLNSIRSESGRKYPVIIFEFELESESEYFVSKRIGFEFGTSDPKTRVIDFKLQFSFPYFVKITL